MAINVMIRCSDCDTISPRSLKATDKEIICPECRRNMPNLSKEEFKQINSVLSGQTVFAILSLLFAGGAMALFYLWSGPVKDWIQSDSKDHLDDLAKSGIVHNADNSVFLYGAIACILFCAVFGFLSARKRFVVEF